MKIDTVEERMFLKIWCICSCDADVLCNNWKLCLLHQRCLYDSCTLLEMTSVFVYLPSLDLL